MLAFRRLPDVVAPLFATILAGLLLLPGCTSRDDSYADGDAAAAGVSRGTASDTGPPELPRVYIDTHLVPPTGRRITVNAGDDLQRALDDAQPGDVLLLAPGAVFVGSFTLPRKNGNGWITIRTAAPDAELPPEGSRITPAFASRLPKIVSGAEDTPALRTAPGAHHYRLLALEITVRSDVRSNGAIVQLGGWRDQTRLADVPHHIIVDRSFVHGHASLNTKRCIAMNSAYTAVVDSYVADCHDRGFDSQAIIGWNGPGPFKIVNDYLEGSGENVMFGGGDPAISELVPSDIEIRHNHFFKPLSWKGVWTVKNILEFKNAQRVLVEGNVFENNWLDAQVGFALVLKSDNQSGGAPWSVTRDVTIRYNKLLNSPGGVDIMATGNNIREPANRILITDNLFDLRGTERLGGLGRLWQLVEDPFEIDIEHNTGLADSIALMLDTRQKSHVVIRDNIITRGAYGIYGTSRGEGNPAIDFYLPGSVITNNLLIGRSPAQYPAGNFFVANTSDVGFVDFDHANYRLRRGSRFKGAGSDGRDLGADFDALEKATAGVVIH